MLLFSISHIKQANTFPFILLERTKYTTISTDIIDKQDTRFLASCYTNRTLLCPHKTYRLFGWIEIVSDGSEPRVRSNSKLLLGVQISLKNLLMTFARVVLIVSDRIRYEISHCILQTQTARILFWSDPVSMQLSCQNHTTSIDKRPVYIN